MVLKIVNAESRLPGDDSISTNVVMWEGERKRERERERERVRVRGRDTLATTNNICVHVFSTIFTTEEMIDHKGHIQTLRLQININDITKRSHAATHETACHA